MTDRPILFSAPMVLGLIREVEAPGTGKTQTRRLLKPQPAPCDHTPWGAGANEFRPSIDEDGVHCATCGNGVRIARTKSGVAGIPIRYRKGDRLWVREAWRTEARFDDLPPRDIPKGSLISYEADYDHEPNDGCRGRYRHGRFMVRWMSRLTNTVTDVRVQRLQEISQEDVLAEGLRKLSKDDGRTWKFGLPDRDGLPGRDDAGWPWAHWSTDHRYAFSQLWDSVNGEDAWAANPWVTPITFTVEKRNIDA